MYIIDDLIGVSDPRRRTLLRTGILNPSINSLLSRVRHTNWLVIADRGFPYWPTIETVDISLVDDVPRVLQVLDAIRANFTIGKCFMAQEFRPANDAAVCASFESGASTGCDYALSRITH